MYRRRAGIRALVGVFAACVAMLASEASAQTCSTRRTSTSQTCTSWRTTTTGVRYCTLWCTGSQVCDNTIYGLGGNIVKKCESGENCPLTSCTAYGTVPYEGCQGECDNDLTNLNEDCGIKGLVVCYDPSCNQKKGEYIVLPGIQGSTGDKLICDKKGKCTNSLKLQPGDTSEICPEGTQFVTFTAKKFKAKSCFCPGGLDDGGVCCADSYRKSDGSCKTKYGTGDTLGTPTCMVSLCSVDLSDYDPESNYSLPYDCSPDTALECGGVTGTPCP